jgi:hypothetical protein
MQRTLNVLGFLIVAALVCAACSSHAQTAAPPSQPAAARPGSTASLSILSPEPGAVVSGPKLTVRLALRGARVVPQTSTHLSPDKGHIHLSVDGRVISMLYGLDQVIEVAPGVHILTAEFVAQDHFPFQPRVVKTLTFTVR